MSATKLKFKINLEFLPSWGCSNRCKGYYYEFRMFIPHSPTSRTQNNMLHTEYRSFSINIDDTHNYNHIHSYKIWTFNAQPLYATKNQHHCVCKTTFADNYTNFLFYFFLRFSSNSHLRLTWNKLSIQRVKHKKSSIHRKQLYIK